jgi:hypothetical protein
LYRMFENDDVDIIIYGRKKDWSFLINYNYLYNWKLMYICLIILFENLFINTIIY